MNRKVTVAGVIAGSLLVGGTTAMAATEEVELFADRYKPKNPKIEKGDKIRFTSEEGVHKVKIKKLDYVSPRLDTGESDTVKFRKKGDYKYTDRLNGDIKGTIEVD